MRISEPHKYEIQSDWLLKYVVHIITTGIYSVKTDKYGGWITYGTV
jgi:hypothetical protein